MDAILDFFSTVFWLCFWLALILGVLALMSYNKLQRLAQEVREKASNVQVAVSKKIQLVNQLIDVVRGFQQAEQFTQLKISQDNTAQAMSGAYQQSGAVLTSLQAVADRFPELKASEQYHRLIDSIQACEKDIESRRNQFNAAVKLYNSERSAIPTVFVARLIGFSEAPYLEFDTSGAPDMSTLQSFRTDDGERLNQLLGKAGDGLLSGARLLANKASEIGAAATEKVKEVRAAQAASAYYYLLPGGVPKGPLPLDVIRAKVESGDMPSAVQVAPVGSDEWKVLAEIGPVGG